VTRPDQTNKMRPDHVLEDAIPV